MAIKVTVVFVVVYILGAINTAMSDYFDMGQTVRASVLWGAFWGPRGVCKAGHFGCIPPYGIVRDAWILDFRPEVQQTIDRAVGDIRKRDLIQRPEI